jgi:hypothetical protein
MSVLSLKRTRFRVPLQRFLPVAFRRSATRIVTPLDKTRALRPRLGITVITPGANVRAADLGIECIIGPLDFGILTHDVNPFLCVDCARRKRFERRQSSYSFDFLADLAE